MGLTAPRITIGWPLVMPPSRPPALLVRRVQWPSGPRPSMTSMTSEPRSPRLLESEPELDALDDRDAHDRRPPALRRVAGPSGRGCRGRSARPWPRPRTRRPLCRRRLRASSIRAIIRSSAAGSGQRSGLASVSSRVRVAAAGSIATPPTSDGVRPDVDPQLGQQCARHGAGRDSRRGFARRRPLEDVADVFEAVLRRAGQVCVARPQPRDRRRPLVAGLDDRVPTPRPRHR